MRKKIITICSSASFYKEVLEIEKKLKKLGFSVKIPATAQKMKRSGNYKVEDYKVWFRNEKAYKMKTRLMNGHFKKVINSDAILVVNQEKKGIKGYIGGNVLMEMVIAYHHKKPIYLWNDIDSRSPFLEEIKGLNSLFLNQDPARIKLK